MFVDLAQQLKITHTTNVSDTCQSIDIGLNVVTILWRERERERESLILDGRDQILQHGGRIEDTVDPHTRSRRDERRQSRKERELFEQIQYDPRFPELFPREIPVSSLHRETTDERFRSGSTSCRC